MSVWRRALLLLCGRGKSERVVFEIDAELRFHLEMRTRDNIAAGMAHEEARTDALHRFGDFEQVRERCLSIEETGKMNFLKSCLWMMAGGWLAFRALSPANYGLRAAILEACAVLILFCLLSSLRSIQRNRLAVRTGEPSAPLQGEKMLGLLDGEEPYPSVFDADARTPVERLIRDE